MANINLYAPEYYLLHKNETLNNGGANTYEDNLFTITGIIQINSIYGYVITAISANVTVAYLDLFPTAGAAIEITDNGGTAISSIKVDSLLIKQAIATTAIGVYDSNLCYVAEVSTNFNKSFKPFIVAKKDGAVTNIRFVYTTNGGATGRIHWHLEWKPLSDDGSAVNA